jgi:hypothetical protein
MTCRPTPPSKRELAAWLGFETGEAALISQADADPPQFCGSEFFPIWLLEIQEGSCFGEVVGKDDLADSRPPKVLPTPPEA